GVGDNCRRLAQITLPPSDGGRAGEGGRTPSRQRATMWTPPYHPGGHDVPTESTELRIVMMGSPAFAVPVLAAVAEMPGARVVGGHSQPDRPRGRGLAVEPPPVARFAAAHGIPVFQPPSLRPPEVQAELAALKPDVIVVAAYGRILPAAVLQIP